MAEEILIGELDIDMDELTQKLISINHRIKEQKEELEDLKKAQKDLADQGKVSTQAYKDNQAQIEVVQANIKGLSQDYRNNQKVLTQVVQAETAQLGTLQKLTAQNRELREEQQRLDLTSKAGIKRNNEINALLNKNTAFIKNNSDAFAQNKINIGNYQSALDGLPGGIGSTTSGITRMTKAALAFIATPFGAILAVIVAAIGALTAGFRKSQPLMDVFHQTMDAIKATISVLIDRVANFTEMLVGVFNKDIRESRQEAKRLNDELLGLDETMSRREKRQARRDAKKGLGEEIKEEYKAARQLTKDMQDLEDAEIAYTKTKAELTKAIEEKRLAAKDENNSDKEKLRNLDEAIELELELMDKEVMFAKERARISQERVDMGKSSRAELKENAELQAKAVEAETQSLKQRRTIASERIGLINRINAAEAKAQKEREDIYKKELEFQRNLNKEFEEIARERQESQIDSLMERLDEEIAREIERNEIAEEYEKNRLIFNLESKRQLNEQAAKNEFDRRLIQLDNQHQAEIEAAEKVGGDVSLIHQKYAIIQVEIEKQARRAKYQVWGDFIGNIGNLFGENTVAAKTAAIAQATINTFLGATAAFAQTPGGIIIKSAAAAAAIAAGIKNVQEIVKVKVPGGGGGGGSAAISQPSAPAQVITSDGGLVTRGLTGDNSAIADAFSRALKENPSGIIIDKVTAKQRKMKIVEDASII